MKKCVKLVIRKNLYFVFLGCTIQNVLMYFIERPAGLFQNHLEVNVGRAALSVQKAVVT